MRKHNSLGSTRSSRREEQCRHLTHIYFVLGKANVPVFQLRFTEFNDLPDRLDLRGEAVIALGLYRNKIFYIRKLLGYLCDFCILITGVDDGASLGSDNKIHRLLGTYIAVDRDRVSAPCRRGVVGREKARMNVTRYHYPGIHNSKRGKRRADGIYLGTHTVVGVFVKILLIFLIPIERFVPVVLVVAVYEVTEVIDGLRRLCPLKIVYHSHGSFPLRSVVIRDRRDKRNGTIKL